MSRYHGRSVCLLAAACACAPASVALASGFALRETTAQFTANAFVGAARADDGLTVFENPAGMVRLNQNEIDGGVNAIVPYAQFSGSDTIFGQPVPGTEGGNAVQAAATGAAFGVWSVTPDFKLGLAITNPFGERVRYDHDFVGRYQSLVSSITDFEFTLAAAYAINRHLSVAAGPVVDYFHARLSQALNIGINQLVGDPTADLQGEDTSVGYTLGVMYQLDDDNRAGITYHSRISHRVTGGQTITPPPLLAIVSPLTAELLQSASGPAQVDVTLPDSATLGLFHRFDSRWSIMGDVQWTHWSLLQELTILPESGAPPTQLTEGFRNTWFGGVGVDFQATRRLKFSAGVSYDESPVVDQFRGSRLPDSSRTNLGGGLTFAVLPNADIQLGYVHIFADDVPITQSVTPAAGVLAGKYSVEGDTYSLSYRFRF